MWGVIGGGPSSRQHACKGPCTRSVQGVSSQQGFTRGRLARAPRLARERTVRIFLHVDALVGSLHQDHTLHEDSLHQDPPTSPAPTPPKHCTPPINTCTTGGGHVFIWNRGGGRMHEGRARVHGDSCKALQGSCKAHVRLLKTLEGCARPDGALRDSCKARRGRAKACETRVRTSRCHGKPRRAPQASCKARRSRARPRGTRARLDGAAHHHGGLVQEPREATAGRARPRRPRAKPRTAPGGNGARPCERRGHL